MAVDKWQSHLDCPAWHCHLGCPVPSNVCLKDPSAAKTSPVGRMPEHHTGSSPKASKIGLGGKGQG